MARVVLVTGGSRGIGRSLVRACVTRGDHVAACARTPFDEPGALGIVADVTAEADRIVAETVARYGRIDVLVNAAGLGGGAFADVMAINATAVAAMCHAVLAVAPRVRIINVSSGVTVAAPAGAAAYVASKHALEGLTRALIADGCDAVAVQLGAVRTAMNPSATAEPETVVAALLDAMVRGRGVIAAWRDERPLDLAGVDGLANPLGPSPLARAALADWAVRGPLERYPAGGALTKLLAAQHGLPLDAIALGAGASELIDRVLGVCVRAGESIVANAPSWPLFPQLCRQRDLTARTVPYRLVDGRVDHALAAIAAACDHAVRLVYLVSPSNPMGAAIDDAAFGAFLAAVPAHVIVVVDEAYIDFAIRPDALRATSHVRTSDRLVAIRSFSKLHGLAGLRIGYAVAQPALAHRIAAAARPFTVVTGAEVAAVAALGDRDHAARTLARVRPSRGLPTDAPFALEEAPGVPRFFEGRYAMVPLWDAT